jgi:hypothetical protein
MIKGFSCPKGFGTGEGDKHEFEYCLTKCENKCLGLPYLVLLIDQIQTDVHTPEMISATSLLGCLRESYLVGITDSYPQPKKMWYTSRGSIIHGILEPIKERIKSNKAFASLDPNRFLVEERFSYKFPCIVNEKTHTVTFSGQIDFYDLSTQTLIDYKTIGDRGINFILTGGAKKDHIIQTNMYRFLLEKAGYPVKRIVISYMSLMNIVETGKSNWIEDRNVLKEYVLEDIPLGNLDKIKDFIEEKATILYKAKIAGILPDPPDEETQKWMCTKNGNPQFGYCSVKENCPYWKTLVERDK